MPGIAGLLGSHHLDGDAQGTGHGPHDLDGICPVPRAGLGEHARTNAIADQYGPQMRRLIRDPRIERCDLLIGGTAVDTGNRSGDGTGGAGDGAELIDGDVSQSA